MSDLAAAGAALLEWINSFPLKEEVRSLQDLNDGRIIWQALRDIDANYFTGDLPEQGPSLSDHWLPRWQNIKQITKTLTSYILDECEQSLPSNIAVPQDLKAIATDASADETARVSNEAVIHLVEAQNTKQLLKMILLAAINSTKATEYIGKMPTLTTATQASLKSIIEEMHISGNDAYENSTASQEATGAPTQTQATDPELLFEQRFGKVMADNDKLSRDKKELENELRDLHNRLARLQENNDILQERLTEAEDSLELNGSAKGSKGFAEDSPMRLLEIRIQTQEDLIATQEGKLSDYEKNTEAMQRTIEKLRASSAKSQNLRDRLDEVTLERDNLAKKANTIDKYKTKLQVAQNLEKENKHLSQEVEELQQRWKDVETDQRKTAGLQQTIDEYRRILPKIEQDRVELQRMKKQLEFDNATLAHRWDDANEQQARDRETISDLTDKIHDMETAQVLAASTGGLEQELSKGTKTESDLQAALTLLKWIRLLTKSRKLEIAKLSAELHELKKTPLGLDSKNAMLQQLLDDAKAKHAALEEMYLETYQEKLMLESSLAEVQRGHPIQGTEVFQKMREQLSNYRRKTADIETELAKTKAQLTASQADRMSLLMHAIEDEHADEPSVSPDGKAEQDALDKLKNSKMAELTDLRADHSLLQKRAEGLEADLDEHKILLQKALRDKNDTKKILTQHGDRLHETEKLGDDLKATLELVKAAYSGRTEGAADLDEQLEKHIKGYATTIKHGRERVAKLTEHTRKQNAIIRNLQDQLKIQEAEGREGVTTGGTSEQKVGFCKSIVSRMRVANTQNSTQQQELLNLQKENKLMATAWYDLTNRLQMNNVVLQRRNDPPRSFLKKQRYQLNQSSVSA